MFYFKQLVGGANTFPYALGAQFPSDNVLGWQHLDGKSKEDGSPVSIFRISANSTNDKKLQAARNGVKRLKSVRDRYSLLQMFAYCTK